MHELIAFLFTFLFTNVNCLDNGLAMTPPMGWLAWERYRCNINCEDPHRSGCINETLFKRMADMLVKDGYKDAGYVYVNIDDCWAAKLRDKNNNLQPDPVRFPSGIKNLSDYMHARGLKLGIYGDFGTLTCGGYPGSKYHLERDANTYAAWGVDMLKLDGCYTDTSDMKDGYPLMSHFLNQTGRPILYSCSWPAYLKETPPYADIAKYCNIWRNWGDIQDSWASVASIINYWGMDKGNFSKIAGPGHFNDPDMLIIGDYGLSIDQQKAQMALWAIMAAPLFMSVDLYAMPPESKAILLNEGVIAVNQDKLGIQGTRVKQVKSISIWTRPVLPKGSWAIAILNMGDNGLPTEVQFNLTDVNIRESDTYTITEIFNNENFGFFDANKIITVLVNPSGVQFFKATPHVKKTFAVVV